MSDAGLFAATAQMESFLVDSKELYVVDATS